MSRNFTHTACVALSTLCLHVLKFRATTFRYGFVCYLRPIDSVTASPFSSCPTCDGCESEQSSVKSRSTTKRKHGQHLSTNAQEPKVPQQTDQQSYRCRVGIVAVLQYWPPICLCRRGSLSRSLARQAQPTHTANLSMK